MRRVLEIAPMEFSREAVITPLVIALPMPDGSFSRFSLTNSPVMAPELAAAFPEITTYAGQGIDDPAATARLDFTPAGFHAQVLSPHGAYYIDPWTKGDATRYTSYFKRDFVKPNDGWKCGVLDDAPANVFAERMADRYGAERGGERAAVNRRVYRLANTATAEYTAFHGGTVSAGQAAIVTAVNRVSGVYETELGIRLTLVANNQNLVFTNSVTDGLSNDNGGSLLSQNQSKCDTIIGPANYDIGHVFSTGGGGVAFLGCVCANGSKAGGVTGLPAPTGDPFYIDYVAHEMGHQFGGDHTFNTSNPNCQPQRSSQSAFEPGSGSTLMAYAGICGSDDLQPNSDPYFHFRSIQQITSYIGGGGNCSSNTATGNNTPTVSATGGNVIPIGTPFSLTAAGSDPDGNPITYCWEERDLGPARALIAGDGGSGPILRSLSPVASGTRTFPRLSGLQNGSNTTLGETLPNTSRTLNFRCTVRDSVAGGGGTGFTDIAVTSNAGAGPFRVTQPSSGSFNGSMTVTWNVANTTAAPVNCSSVRILLSTDAGATFPTVLESSTANDGSQVVTLPAISTTQGRIKVEAIGNIFFDINDANFSVTSAPPPGAFSLLSPTSGASNVPLPITLSWSASANASSYTVIVDTDSLLSFPNVVNTSVTGTSYAVPLGTLAPGTFYYWRVIAVNSASTLVGSPSTSQFTAALPPTCTGDISGDGAVNTVDLSFLLSRFGTTVPPNTLGDLNGDGFVNTVDLSLLLANFGRVC